ncbi:MAG: type II toxin-antitoxin system VapC family toxin [Actinomycetia bacterium]|nr:type II toxin-antitoxin system VapC family toxin [Actinomycetes bacterium]
MFVLDTNVLSEIRKGRSNKLVLDWIRNRDPDSLYTTSINIFEIQLGISRVPRHDGHQTDVLTTWLEKVLVEFRRRILPFDHVAAIEAAKVHAGTNIEHRDCMIGAIANLHRMPVVTRNAKHLVRVANRVINPWDG